ncbi:EAL domain-containing protein [Ideonella paludis]|uniref:PTS sugar transporter subunit IIC/EAL domain-containing protein n=1 Tax=Ideonella paludis TaxID=1233411 RepID=A0ABS5DY74_9BURK|nr:EAL domain-containing protein [Ideonella paludis]MBQ0935781.1 PTS sugar transporter subunit IIC/EAL domain-containing protein [Ideonella paludis]
MKFPSLETLSHGRLAMALRESFLALLPLFILMHAVGLLVDLAVLRSWELPWNLLPVLRSVRLFLMYCWPLAIGLALTIHLARAYEVDPVIAAILVLGLLLVAVQTNGEFQSIKLRVAWVSIGAILLPLLGVWMLRLFLSAMPQLDTRALSMISPALARTVVHIVPFALSFTSLSVALIVLPSGMQAPLGLWVRSLPDGVVLVLSVLVVNGLWWTGIHGAIAWDLLTGNALWEIQIGGGATLAELMYGLVYAGGSGCALALALCLWWYVKDDRDRRVLRWALPFAAVNISEPLLFGLPVVGQRRLLIPFLLAPLAGAAIALMAFHWGWVHFDRKVYWMLPFGLNAWALSSDPWALVGVQGLILLTAVAVYRPFVRQLALAQSMTEFSRHLAEQLGVGPSQELDAERRYAQSLAALQASHSEAQEAMKLVERGSLHLYYQPKVSAQTGRITGLEALLRLELPDGTVLGPGRFLPALERAGYGDMFDAWVIRQVGVDRAQWRDQHFECSVAINLTAASLADERAFAAMMQQLSGPAGDGLEVELLESSLASEPAKVKAHLGALRSRGGKVLVDDFGTGYANLAVFHSADVDAVKIDRSLLVGAAESRGAQLYREICSTLQRLGYKLVAEGVETLAEMSFVRSCGVQDVQGFWVSRPLPARAVPGSIAGIEARLGAAGAA